jgi:hypothetical protein
MVLNAPKWILSLIRPGDVHCKGIDRLVDWTPSYLSNSDATWLER